MAFVRACLHPLDRDSWALILLTVSALFLPHPHGMVPRAAAETDCVLEAGGWLDFSPCRSIASLCGSSESRQLALS